MALALSCRLVGLHGEAIVLRRGIVRTVEPKHCYKKVCGIFASALTGSEFLGQEFLGGSGALAPQYLTKIFRAGAYYSRITFHIE